MDQANAGATPYKDLKVRILQSWGKKPGDAYLEAMAMLLVDKPSQLANQLVNTICVKHPNLVDCCAAGVVTGMWCERLPAQVCGAAGQHQARRRQVARERAALLGLAPAVHARLPPPRGGARTSPPPRCSFLLITRLPTRTRTTHQHVRAGRFPIFHAACPSPPQICLLFWALQKNLPAS